MKAQDITKQARKAAERLGTNAGVYGAPACVCCGLKVPWNKVRWWIDHNGNRCCGHDCPRFPLPEMEPEEES